MAFSFCAVVPSHCLDTQRYEEAKELTPAVQLSPLVRYVQKSYWITLIDGSVGIRKTKKLGWRCAAAAGGTGRKGRRSPSWQSNHSASRIRKRRRGPFTPIFHPLRLFPPPPSFSHSSLQYSLQQRPRPCFYRAISWRPSGQCSRPRRLGWFQGRVQTKIPPVARGFAQEVAPPRSLDAEKGRGWLPVNTPTQLEWVTGQPPVSSTRLKVKAGSLSTRPVCNDPTSGASNYRFTSAQ